MSNRVASAGRVKSVLIPFAILLGSLPMPLSAEFYHMTAITMSPPLEQNPQDMNDALQVAMFVSVNSDNHAVLWSPISGALDLGPQTYVATGVSNSGQVTGYDQSGHAFIWTPASGVQTIPNSVGFNECVSRGINNSGEIAGFSHSAGPQVAWTWSSPSGFTALAKLSGGDSAYTEGLNDVGQVVGASRAADGNLHAVVWSPAGVPRNLFPTARLSTANEINNSGMVIGARSLAGENAHAYIWSDSAGATALYPSDFLSIANDINSAGQVVGTYQHLDRDPPTVFLWDSVHKGRDLNKLLDVPSLLKLTSVFCINDHSEILARATDSGGHSTFVILSPVPELSTLALAALGALGLPIAARRWR